MTESILQDAGAELSASGFRGFLPYGNHPPLTEADLNRELSKRLANYISAVRDAGELPPHAFPESAYFLEAVATRRLVTLAHERGDTDPFLPPVAPIPQNSEIWDFEPEEGPNVRPPPFGEATPDSGRRVQLWFDELAPGAPPLRSDEAVRFVRRAAWLGQVEAIAGERFRATLWDRAHPERPEQAEFFIEQLSEGDQERVQEGAFFYWNIGYTENLAGARTNSSRLRLSRLRAEPPRELAPDIERAADAAAAVLDRPPPPP